MNTNKLPLYLDTTFQSIYGNFGQRFAAVFLDGLILLPLTIGVLFFNSMQLSNYYYTFVISQLIILAYFIYLPVRYGATPGKLLLGLTILKLNGTAISYRESFLKMAPIFILALMGFAIQCYSISLADEDTFNNLKWMQQSNYLKSFSPYLIYLEIAVANLYYVCNLIIFLINKRKRSIGDQLAGTVVVYTRFLNSIKEITSTEKIVENA